MERYALKKAFDEITEDGLAPPALRDLIAKNRGLLQWDELSRYEQIDPANARLARTRQ